MNRRWLGGLFLAGLLVALAAAYFERAPGYMDADYYYAGALRIVEGRGASEPYLWNYLNHPEEIPAPSFSYWMPLTSLVAAPGLLIARPWGFFAARLGFLILAACVPPLTALLACRLNARPRQALLAGMLALLPGFYLPFTTTTDSFSIYMVLGAVFFLILSRIFSNAAQHHGFPWRWLILLGVTTGLMHMTRADGLLWLGAAGLVGLYGAKRLGSVQQPFSWRSIFLRAALTGALIVGGYLAIAWPWFLRNLSEWGSLLPPGGSRAMWITEYEQTMIYPPELLTPERWLAAGWSAHFQSWLEALGSHIQTAVAVQGEIIIFPFILAGFWKQRRHAIARLGGFLWLLTAAVMTVLFPFAGINGGFFHSGAALQPLFWALAPFGAEQVALWYASKRRLETHRKILLFLSGVMILVGVTLSGLLYVERVIGDNPAHAQWGGSETHYREVEVVLQGLGAEEGAAVLVNNPPGFWLASRRPAAVIPYGDERTLIAAAVRYRAGYVVLETNNPRQLSDLYHERVSPPELEYLTSVGNTKLFRVRGSEE